MPTISRYNVYNVPSAKWSKWTNQAREVFNRVYSTVRANQRNYLHSKAEPYPQPMWTVTAWNLAWEAANAASNVDMDAPSPAPLPANV